MAFQERYGSDPDQPLAPTGTFQRLRVPLGSSSICDTLLRPPTPAVLPI